MPELPEVHTIATQLNTVLPGKVIESVEVRREKSLQGPPFAHLSLKLRKWHSKASVGAQQSGSLVDRQIKSVERKQKIIVITLCRNCDISLEKGDSNEIVLLIHLKMTGQLIFVPSALSLVPSKKKPGTKHQGLGTRIVGGHPLRQGSGQARSIGQRIVGGHPTGDWIGELPSKHTRVIISFTDGSTLYFNDQRVFGWMKIVSGEQWVEYRQRMAPDVIDPEFTVKYFANVLKRSRRAVKLVMLDQEKIGGLGNIYANDALYLAGIHPLRKSNSLTRSEVLKLHQAMVQVINRGIETGGASYSHYVDTEGLGGRYQDEFLVYDRKGELCGKCKSQISKISLGGRGTYYCAHCQR